MSNIKIIKYNSEYQKEVRRFILTTLKEFGFDYKTEWDYDLDDPNKYYDAFFILLYDDRIKGTIAIKHHNDETAEVKRLYIDKDTRGKGYGSRLFDKALEFVKKKKFKKVILDTWVRFDAAVILYKKRGFKEIKTEGEQIFMEKVL
ncbi:MAG: GNAT family N-acetyltransferase [Patescibacteria group bacterium]|jgi:putative acetyltransferase